MIKNYLENLPRQIERNEQNEATTTTKNQKRIEQNEKIADKNKQQGGQGRWIKKLS